MSLLAMTAQPWRERAVCITADPRLFFTEHQGQRSDEGKAVCVPCPVKAECLAHALNQLEYYGVWGGLTENERRQIIRSRNVVQS